MPVHKGVDEISAVMSEKTDFADRYSGCLCETCEAG